MTKQLLTEWSRTDFVAVVSSVATLFVENVLAHPDGAMSLRLETNGITVTVAVDASSFAWRRQPTDSSADVNPCRSRLPGLGHWPHLVENDGVGGDRTGKPPLTTPPCQITEISTMPVGSSVWCAYCRWRCLAHAARHTMLGRSSWVAGSTSDVTRTN